MTPGALSIKYLSKFLVTKSQEWYKLSNKANDSWLHSKRKQEHRKCLPKLVCEKLLPEDHDNAYIEDYGRCYHNTLTLFL